MINNRLILLNHYPSITVNVNKLENFSFMRVRLCFAYNHSPSVISWFNNIQSNTLHCVLSALRDSPTSSILNLISRKISFHFTGLFILNIPNRENVIFRTCLNLSYVKWWIDGIYHKYLFLFLKLVLAIKNKETNLNNHMLESNAKLVIPIESVIMQ